MGEQYLVVFIYFGQIRLVYDDVNIFILFVLCGERICFGHLREKKEINDKYCFRLKISPLGSLGRVGRFLYLFFSPPSPPTKIDTSNLMQIKQIGLIPSKFSIVARKVICRERLNISYQTQVDGYEEITLKKVTKLLNS